MLRRILLFLMIPTLLLACGEYKDVTFTGVNSFNIEKAKGGGFNIILNARVKNPNNYTIKVKGSDLALYLGGSKIGEANVNKAIVLKKDSYSDYDVTIHTDLKQIAGGGLTGLLGGLMGGGLELKVAGNLKASAKGVSTKIPVEYAHPIDINELSNLLK